VLRFGSFYAVRNDLSLVIKNSSQLLCDFLSIAMYSSSKTLPVFGIAPDRIKFSSLFAISNKDFIYESKQEAEPLRVKASFFPVPSSYGSVLSIEFIDSFLKCTQKDVFKVQFASAYLIYKWNRLLAVTYIYTALLWANLALLALYFSLNAESSIYAVIGLIIEESLLLGWEILQMKALGKMYFLDKWNWVDILRITATFTWIALGLCDIRDMSLNWVVVLMNIIRGFTGFRAFTMTRYYIHLILVSIQKIIPFLIIFIYTTLCFGLLKLVALNEAVGFVTLWLESFYLVTGKTDYFESESLDLLSITFMVAVFMNVILMLNMIISIFGDSFDEFQILQVYYDKKEMCEVILEIEQIFSLFSPKEENKFLHICTDFYRENEGGIWQGRAIDVHDVVENNAERTQEQIKAVEGNLTERIAGVEGKLTDKIVAVEDNIKIVKGNMKDVEGNIKELNDKMAGVDSKLEELLKILAK
jgi:hypothetical protein